LEQSWEKIFPLKNKKVSATGSFMIFSFVDES